jgi:hypothetical protein
MVLDSWNLIWMDIYFLIGKHLVFSSPEHNMLMLIKLLRSPTIRRLLPCMVKIILNISFETFDCMVNQTLQEWSSKVTSPFKVVQMVLVFCISRWASGARKGVSKIQVKKTSCLKVQGPELWYLVYKHVMI